MGKITAVFEPAPGEQYGVVAWIVGAGVAQVAAEKRGGGVEQCAAPLALGFHGSEEFVETTHDGPLDLEQLLDALGVTSVMREVVVLGIDAFDLRHAVVILDDDTDNARGISLYDQRNEIEQQPDTANEVGLVGDVRRRFGLHFRLGTVEPDLFLGEVLFRGADGFEIFLQPLAIGSRRVLEQYPGLAEQLVQHAAALGQLLFLTSDLLRFAAQEHFRKHV